MIVMLVPGNAVAADHQDWEPDPPPGATHQWGGGILIERTGVDGRHPSAAGREAMVAALPEAGHEPLYP